MKVYLSMISGHKNDPLLFDVCHAVNNFTTLSFRFLAKAIEQFLERRPFSR